jgi:hypothetical protein
MKYQLAVDAYYQIAILANNIVSEIRPQTLKKIKESLPTGAKYTPGKITTFISSAY